MCRSLGQQEQLGKQLQMSVATIFVSSPKLLQLPEEIIIIVGCLYHQLSYVWSNGKNYHQLS